MLNIQSSTNYDQFKFASLNRKISRSHVKKFIRDKTFPDNFKHHPIIVNEHFEIFDGQHRFEAAKHLKIPVYFLMCDGISYSIIMNINVNQKKWEIDDYIRFFSNDPNYKFINDIKEITKFDIVHVNAAIAGILDTSSVLFTRQLKTREVVLSEENKTRIETFFSLFEFPFKDAKANSAQGGNFVLLTTNYFWAFGKFFKDNPKKFEKLMALLPNYWTKLPYARKSEEALEFIERLGSMRKKSEELEIRDLSKKNQVLVNN